MSFYADIQAMAADLLKEFKQGFVTLTRSTPGAVDPSAPWVIPVATTETYELDAVVRGVSAKYVDGTTIVASDLMATCSPKAVHTLTNGAAADGAIVDLEPLMTDAISIDGAVRTVKKITPIPAAGPVVSFLIFVAG
jgi:hypothetical protein